MTIDTTLLINGPHLDFRPLFCKDFLEIGFQIRPIYVQILNLQLYKVYQCV